MVRHGKPPYLECSSKGDKRFSAFYARIRAHDNKTIEELYQARKVLADGRTGLSIRDAKGKRPVNLKECSRWYAQLWDWYIAEHPILLNVLLNQTGLSDVFGVKGHCCQATELWRIRKAHKP